MKHNKLLALLVLPMMISACSPKAGFNTIEYEKELEGTEKAVVLANVRAALMEKLVSVSGKMEGFSKSDLVEAKGTYETNITLNADGYIRTKGSYDVTTTANGAKQHTVRKSDTKTFEYDKDKFATYGTNDDDFVFSTTTSTAQEQYEDVVEGIIDDFDGFTVAVDKKGNTKIFSTSKQETYTPITWGEKTKVVHSIVKSQQYYEIAKDYTIKSSYMYQSQETNQDPDTGNVKDKVSKVMEIKYSYTYKYGTRASKIGEYQNELAEIKGKTYFVGTPSISVAYYKGTDLYRSSYATQSAKRLALDKYQMTIQGTLESSYFYNEYADRIALQGSANLGKYGAESTSETFLVPFTGFVGNTNVEVSNNNYLVVKNPTNLSSAIKLTVSFIVTVEANKPVVQNGSVQIVVG